MSAKRHSSSAKNKWQPSGPITFSAQAEEDIKGIDEAFQSFRKLNQSDSTEAKQQTAAAPQQADQDSVPSGSGTGFSRATIDDDSSESFEVAIEANAIADEEFEPGLSDIPESVVAQDEFASKRMNLTRQEVTDSDSNEGSATTAPILISGRPANSEENNMLQPLSSSASAPSICVSPDNFELEDPFASPSIPVRPPPFQPRQQPEPVAAEDIHALLDSFSPPKGTAGPVEPQPPKRPPPPRSSVPTVKETASPIQFGGDSLVVDQTPSLPDRPQTHQRSRSASICRSESVNSLRNLNQTIPPTFADLVQHSRPPVAVSTKPRPTKSHSRPTLGTGVLCVAVLVAISASFYFFSTFAWGIIVGISCTLLILFIRQSLWSCPIDPNTPICHISGLPLGELCCSLHCQPAATGFPTSRETWWPIFAPAIPQLRHNPPRSRDLQSLNIPYMKEEDINCAASGGPLGDGLGFKFDKANKPVYKGWMNEVANYDPETHHVNRTHSVFVTLDGTHLRLQRPRRNISRRSMWNDELPSASATRFQHQRIFDLAHARVTLLPSGLVSKRLWSKKYPIALTLLHPNRRTSLPASMSSPNIRTQSPLGPATFDGTDGVEHSRSPTPAVEDFYLVTHTDVESETLYLFGRTCREKEAWYRRLRAASLGVPLLWTPQLAVQLFLTGSQNTTQDQRSDDDARSDADPNGAECSNDNNSTSTDKAAQQPTASGILPGSREPLYLTYMRYMAKYMPADWLVRGSQALRLNVNYISCDPSLLWLNAFLARIFWDFLREVYWLERVRDKIQAKLKKIHLPPFISDLVVVGIELGSELPVIRRIGRPHVDPHGLWFELDVAYAGGFSVALETNVNLLRWNQKNRAEREAANLADDTANSTLSGSLSSDQNFSPIPRRSSKLGAFLSDEEDSADSTTDSDDPTEAPPPGPNSLRKSSVPRLSGLSNTSLDEDRPPTGESPIQLPSALPSRKRFIRLVDRIARSSYFQKAVDNKLVQRGMELLSNTPIVLEAEIQTLSGTLLVNIPPPPSDRLWYGFQPSPQLRLKARPRVGEKAVTMSRILEWIENRVVLEFQRLLVLPNMDDLPIPLLLSDVSAGDTK